MIRTQTRTRGLMARGLVVAGLTGVLAAGALGSAPSAPAPLAAPATAVVEAAVEPVAFCPFGKNANGGCRGGSINDNERLNRSLADTGLMYKDAAECAGKAVGKSLWNNRKKPSLPGVALGTVAPAVKCGQSKGY
ncbi:hypothetical protein Ae168Ps1_6199 [Pseudonocardia sp. Ae168_Ps1]|uniref:hypothetical protein n=1 Tax=unclassified Pseudonocardia TaxID=2619320 RepID=UPI00094B04B9|nr:MULTISPECIES: hypothetical protein [unclassified Pseudonocardia]OLL70452.1 hypothetical protein Ae168Ps1_6199 [Pseudonocardia sp. Ae168_Ps1]OLL71571.1 hypothetical protein Ae263Ps1_6059 [Pseudonocardia sp. Ae263_Ps1]